MTCGELWVFEYLSLVHDVTNRSRLAVIVSRYCPGPLVYAEAASCYRSRAFVVAEQGIVDEFKRSMGSRRALVTSQNASQAVDDALCE